MKYTIFLILFLLFFTKISFSHKLNTFAYREGNQIKGEAYFADGSPCIKCVVEVYNEKGDKIFQTITDEKGKYEFVLKERGLLKIKVNAGEGHIAQLELKGIKEPNIPSTLPKTLEKKKGSEVSKKEVPNSKKFQTTSNINEEEMRKIIKEVVKEEMEGMENLLVEIRKDINKVQFQDVIGGIGYIFGIFGIIMILKAKYKK